MKQSLRWAKRENPRCVSDEDTWAKAHVKGFSKFIYLLADLQEPPRYRAPNNQAQTQKYNLLLSLSYPIITLSALVRFPYRCHHFLAHFLTVVCFCAILASATYWAIA